MTPSEQLDAIQQGLLAQLAHQSACWRNDVLPKLEQAGIQICRYSALPPTQRALLRQYFAQDIFPVLTPLAFDPAHPFPHISNLSMNLAVVINDPQYGERFARIKVTDAEGAMFPRLVRIPGEDKAEVSAPGRTPGGMSHHFVWLEDLVAANLDMLFPGLEVVAVYPFRITRDADLEIKEDEAADLLTNIEEQVEMRHFGSVVRLELDQATPERIQTILMKNLHLAPYQVYAVDGPPGFADVMELTHLDRPDLKDVPFAPTIPGVLARQDSYFTVIRREDMLLYHPYDSFMPVVDFIREAARDPDVLAIKQTLYRVGANSPIVSALMEARENGKQVAVLLELKARFDEENNIAWARALEDAGVHVAYGVLGGLKTHAKICLVVRREAEGIRCYVHMSTGNYNTLTGRIYTDLSYFSCDPDLWVWDPDFGADVPDLFNALTGYSRKNVYRKLLVAPGSMRQSLLARIEREIARQCQHGDGYLAFKMNALVDRQCIQALYRASQAGVIIDLQVRGICCLRPGIPGVSETITVTSIVGRFLEHARIYYFRNGGQEEVFVGSADLMPRNLDRRIELLFPVDNPRLRKTIVHDILRVHLHDNVQARRLLPDGSYERLSPQAGEPSMHSQAWLLAHWKDQKQTHEA